MEKCYPCPPTFLLPISPADQTLFGIFIDSCHPSVFIEVTHRARVPAVHVTTFGVFALFLPNYEGALTNAILLTQAEPPDFAGAFDTLNGAHWAFVNRRQHYPLRFFNVVIPEGDY